MKLRTAVLAFSLFVPLSHSFADEPISISSAPFQSVDYWDGLNSRIVFDSVKLHEKSWKLAVPADKVEIVLLEEKMPPRSNPSRVQRRNERSAVRTSLGIVPERRRPSKGQRKAIRSRLNASRKQQSAEAAEGTEQKFLEKRNPCYC